MAVFNYQAVTGQGETRSGTITAGSEQEAVARIQTMGLMVMSVASGPSAHVVTEPLRQLRTRKTLRHSDIVDLTRQFSVLIGAGLPLDRALEIIRSVSRIPPLVELVEQIQEAVRGGDSLSAALANFPQHFSDFYINFIRSAEFSGNLGDSLYDLAQHLDKAQALREQLKSALVYPLILVFVTVVSLALIFIYVLPEFAQMFADMDAELPTSTAMILGIADWLDSYSWLIFALILAGLLYVRMRSRDEEWLYAWDVRLLRIPMVGDLVSKVEMARLSRGLGTLLRGGVPLLDALDISREGVQNRLMASELAVAVDSLQKGSSLVAPLIEAGVFPDFALQMIQVGEESGKLDEMLLKVADIYDSEVSVTTQRLLSVLEPALIIGLGFAIGGIIMSILVAILTINEIPL